MQVKLNTILLSPSSPLIEYHTSIKMDWNLLWFFVTKILLTFADSLIFIKGLQFGYLWKIIWQIFMFSEKLYEEVNYFGKNLLKFFPYNTTYLFTGIFWGNCCILIHNIANWLKIQKMVNPEIYFFFFFL